MSRGFDPERCKDRNDRAKTFKISGQQLRTLNVSYNQFATVAINAPNLKSFTFFNDDDFIHFTKLVLPSLVHADIRISNRNCPAKKYIDYVDDFITFFTGLGNVTSLALRQSTLEILHHLCKFLEEQPSPFTRLETLTLEPYDDHRNREVVHYFTKGSNMNWKVKFV